VERGHVRLGVQVFRLRITGAGGKALIEQAEVKCSYENHWPLAVLAAGAASAETE
jgi:hypothetical protein